MSITELPTRTLEEVEADIAELEQKYGGSIDDAPDDEAAEWRYLLMQRKALMTCEQPGCTKEYRYRHGEFNLCKEHLYVKGEKGVLSRDLEAVRAFILAARELKEETNEL